MTRIRTDRDAHAQLVAQCDRRPATTWLTPAPVRAARKGWLRRWLGL